MKQPNRFPEVGKKLKSIRLGRMESQKTVSKKAGITVYSLRAIEKGDGNVLMVRVYHLCDYYGCKVSEIYEVDKPKKGK